MSSNGPLHVTLVPLGAGPLPLSTPPFLNEVCRVSFEPNRVCPDGQLSDLESPCPTLSFGTLPAHSVPSIRTDTPRISKSLSIAKSTTLSSVHPTLPNPPSTIIGPPITVLPSTSTLAVPASPGLTSDLAASPTWSLFRSSSYGAPTTASNSTLTLLANSTTPFNMVTHIPTSTGFTETSTVPSESSMPPDAPGSQARVRLGTPGAIAGIGVGVVAGAMLLVLAVISRMRRQRRERPGPSVYPFSGMSDSEPGLAQLCLPSARPTATAWAMESNIRGLAPSILPFHGESTSGVVSRPDKKQLLKWGNGSFDSAPGGRGASDQTDAAFEGEVGVGYLHGVNQSRGARQETDGGVRLAGGRPGDVVYSEFDKHVSSDRASELDRSESESGCTLPPSYCSDFRETCQ